MSDLKLRETISRLLCLLLAGLETYEQFSTSKLQPRVIQRVPAPVAHFMGVGQSPFFDFWLPKTRHQNVNAYAAKTVSEFPMVIFTFFTFIWVKTSEGKYSRMWRGGTVAMTTSGRTSGFIDFGYDT